MHFELVPPTGIGPLRIGMPRHEANTALLSLRAPSTTSPSDRPGRHVFRPSGLMISISCVRDRLESVELGRPSSTDDTPEDEQGHYFNSVLVARPGYYDGPTTPQGRTAP
ncbi:hypothetical protein [Streptomyces sp. 4F14]|uniref:hypothetical protein n=1 Tax=Streptomyces sp. 4F14 TaxID=3394380 RepID=UPI003A89EB34